MTVAPVGRAASATRWSIAHGVRVVPVVQHVHEEVGVETGRHPGERVTAHGLDARARDGQAATTWGRSNTVPSRCGTRSSKVARRSPVPPPTSQTRARPDQSTAAASVSPCMRPPAAIAPSNAPARSGCCASSRRTVGRSRPRTHRVPSPRAPTPHASRRRRPRTRPTTPATRMAGAQELCHARRRHPARAVEAHPAARLAA